MHSALSSCARCLCVILITRPPPERRTDWEEQDDREDGGDEEGWWVCVMHYSGEIGPCWHFSLLSNAAAAAAAFDRLSIIEGGMLSNKRVVPGRQSRNRSSLA